MFLFALLTLVLPHIKDAFFTRPSRVTVLHAGCWLAVAVCSFIVQSSLPDQRLSVLTDGAANVSAACRIPMLVLSLGNAAFLTLVAIDSFLADNEDSTLVTDNIVCSVAWIEMLAVLASASYCIYNRSDVNEVLRGAYVQHKAVRDRSDSRSS